MRAFTKSMDKVLLNKLRQNSRTSLMRLSRETGFPVSTIYDKIKKMEQGLIKRYTAIIDFEKLGYKIHLIFMLKTDDTAELIDDLITCPYVNTILKTNYDYNLLLECFFRNAREMNSFVHKINHINIKGKKMFYVLNDIKREMSVII